MLLLLVMAPLVATIYTPCLLLTPLWCLNFSFSLPRLPIDDVLELFLICSLSFVMLWFIKTFSLGLNLMATWTVLELRLYLWEVF